jgi:hypothetical protein
LLDELLFERGIEFSGDATQLGERRHCSMLFRPSFRLFDIIFFQRGPDVSQAPFQMISADKMKLEWTMLGVSLVDTIESLKECNIVDADLNVKLHQSGRGLIFIQSLALTISKR